MNIRFLHAEAIKQSPCCI